MSALCVYVQASSEWEKAGALVQPESSKTCDKFRWGSWWCAQPQLAIRLRQVTLAFDRARESLREETECVLQVAGCRLHVGWKIRRRTQQPNQSSPTAAARPPYALVRQ